MSEQYIHYGWFEVREDEDTGRRYWWGGEDAWKDPTEIGEDGVIIIDARHFQIGTIITLKEPNGATNVADADRTTDPPQHNA